MASVTEKVIKLFDEIRAACEKSGRDYKDVKVLAAAKYATADQLMEAISAGISIIGENKVQDAVRNQCLLLAVNKHFIGHLQTNKVKEAVRIFDCIESVDSYRLAEMINIEAERALKKMKVLIEVNIASDPRKYGIASGEVRHFLRKIDVLKYLEVKGLMAIAPFSEDPEESRECFRKMKKLYVECRKGRPEMDTLSMGMTHDFRVAVEEGANEVRIGSYLFK